MKSMWDGLSPEWDALKEKKRKEFNEGNWKFIDDWLFKSIRQRREFYLGGNMCMFRERAIIEIRVAKNGWVVMPVSDGLEPSTRDMYVFSNPEDLANFVLEQAVVSKMQNTIKGKVST